jgi:hypothetical protein
MVDQQAYVYCPHIIEATKQRCGVEERGRGRFTKIPIPFSYLDGKEFVVTCPQCGNEVLVESRLVQDDDEGEEPT